jgi:uncharacterized protein YlxP (DUF503 family)
MAEIEDQDIHQFIGLGISYVTTDNAQADSISDHVLNFIEGNIEGSIIQIEREIL